MKNILILLLFSFCLMMIPDQSQAQKYEHTSFSIDTLTDTGTINFTWDERFKDKGSCEFYIKAINISGTGGGTISYQYSLDPVNTYWITGATDTIPAAGTAEHSAKFTDLTGVKVRVSVTGSGTHTTSLEGNAAFKQDK